MTYAEGNGEKQAVEADVPYICEPDGFKMWIGLEDVDLLDDEADHEEDQTEGGSPNGLVFLGKKKVGRKNILCERINGGVVPFWRKWWAVGAVW